MVRRVAASEILADVFGDAALGRAELALDPLDARDDVDGRKQGRRR